MDQKKDAERIILGSNYRMTEVHAAIGIEQLKKLDGFLVQRHALADRLTDGLEEMQGLKGVTVPEGYTHSYYVYPIQFDSKVWEISRETFANAMEAEGFPLGRGYVKPIYLMNIYQHKHVYNDTTYPFAFIDQPVQEYQRGICPVVEKMYDDTLLIADVCRVPFTVENIDEFLTAIRKVWEERKALRSL